MRSEEESLVNIVHVSEVSEVPNVQRESSWMEKGLLIFNIFRLLRPASRPSNAASWSGGNGFWRLYTRVNPTTLW